MYIFIFPYTYFIINEPLDYEKCFNRRSFNGTLILSCFSNVPNEINHLINRFLPYIINNCISAIYTTSNRNINYFIEKYFVH